MVKTVLATLKTPGFEEDIAVLKSEVERGSSGMRSRQDVRERLVLMEVRKVRPRRTLRIPMAKRKKADTRAKVPTWWESTAAPMLIRRFTTPSR